ncbi:MAG TPA: hypothetical protein VGU20_02875 [Stellaceae bacterium]|nr:hypothetical protein [Stellaceae bacterium]
MQDEEGKSSDEKGGRVVSASPPISRNSSAADTSATGGGTPVASLDEARRERSHERWFAACDAMVAYLDNRYVDRLVEIGWLSRRDYGDDDEPPPPRAA